MSYQALASHFRRLGGLEDALGVLHWDASVMMPDGGVGDRQDQLAALVGVHHELLVRPEVGEWLAVAESETLDLWQRANLEKMKRAYLRATAVPGDLVEALARACSTCESLWRRAREESNYSLVAESFETQLSLSRQAAQAKGEALGLDPYDALLDEHSPGFLWSDIAPLFDDLAAFLPSFLDQVLAAQGQEGSVLEGPFKTKQQAHLARKLMEQIGFDFSFGRLDTSLHPFCGGTPNDVRITTRYDESDFLIALMGVIHETGHGLYERGLPGEWAGQPVGRAQGMAVHESQSLLMEMQACRTPEFFRFAAPLFRQEFDADGSDWDAEAFYRRAIRVERGFIRVDADEVTYPLHVILRAKLERALIDGSLRVRDLPKAWNAEFESLIGVPVPDDRRGCLQDIHWYDGAWGYFPSYTLGAMMAAQFFAAALKAVPSIPGALAQGDFKPLLGWLRFNVHAKASSLSARDLLTQATGKPLDTETFKAHLAKRYLAK